MIMHCFITWSITNGYQMSREKKTRLLLYKDRWNKNYFDLKVKKKQCCHSKYGWRSHGTVCWFPIPRNDRWNFLNVSTNLEKEKAAWNLVEISCHHVILCRENMQISMKMACKKHKISGFSFFATLSTFNWDVDIWIYI